MVQSTNDDSNPFGQLPFHLYFIRMMINKIYNSTQNIVSHSLNSRWKTDTNPIKTKMAVDSLAVYCVQSAVLYVQPYHNSIL